MKKVFLGGTCNKSLWRDKFIPKLKIYDQCFACCQLSYQKYITVEFQFDKVRYQKLCNKFKVKRKHKQGVE